MVEPNRENNTINNVVQLDLSEATLGALARAAGRICTLLGSGKAKSSPEVTAILDDFLGAIYALAYAKKSEFQDRPTIPIEVPTVVTRAEQLAKGLVRTDGKWMAGFYFNSALFRLSGTYHRALTIVVGHGGDVGNLRPDAEQLYRGWTGKEWGNSNVRAIHGQVVDLKHIPKGTFEHRRTDAGMANAVSAVDELLDLLEAWR
jgi:hypothetical protein